MGEKIVWKIVHKSPTNDDPFCDQSVEHIVIADGLQDAVRIYQEQVSPAFRTDEDSFMLFPMRAIGGPS